MAKPTQVSTFIMQAFAAKGLSVQQLIVDFDKWKALPTLDAETEVFGRNGLNDGSKILSHVHMVHVNDDAAAKKWVSRARAGRGNRGNRYLFYVDGGAAYGYLLLAIIDDPHGHDIWNSEHDDLRAKWDTQAENFYDNGIVP